MTTYRTGDHHGVTICAEGDGVTCARPGHDCARGHLVAVIVNGDQALGERICALLNGDERSGWTDLTADEQRAAVGLPGADEYRPEPVTVSCPMCPATSQDLAAHMADYHSDGRTDWQAWAQRETERFAGGDA